MSLLMSPHIVRPSESLAALTTDMWSLSAMTHLMISPRKVPCKRLPANTTSVTCFRFRSTRLLEDHGKITHLRMKYALMSITVLIRCAIPHSVG
jgi:hypothetical protein